MFRAVVWALALAVMLGGGAGTALAGDLAIDVVDGAGKPVANAVITLDPPAGSAAPAPAVPSAPLLVDQINETFVPYVLVAPKGAAVVFRNSDTTRHQVYSFSPPKPFQLITAPGETSPQVALPQTGVVVVGCNIHDQMIAYVYVTDRPYSAQTGPDGKVRLSGLPDGAYTAHIWHPQLRPGRPEPTQAVAVGQGAAPVTVSLPLMAPPAMSMGGDRERSRY